MDFIGDNVFRDDPADFFKGSLVGPDGKTMRIYAVDDKKVRGDIAKSALSRVSFRAVSDSLLIVVLDTQS